MCVDCKKSRIKKKRTRLSQSKIFFNVYCEKVKSECEENKSESDDDRDYFQSNEDEDEITKLNKMFEKNKNGINLNPSEENYNYQWYCLDYVENPSDLKKAVSKFLNYED
jgi:hypothetical protein